jgi:hypothetical protein
MRWMCSLLFLAGCGKTLTAPPPCPVARVVQKVPITNAQGDNVAIVSVFTYEPRCT